MSIETNRELFPHNKQGKERAIARYGDNWPEHVDFWADDDADQPSARVVLDSVALAVRKGEISVDDVDIHAVDSRRVAEGMPRAFPPRVSYCGNEAECVFPATMSTLPIVNLPA